MIRTARRCRRLCRAVLTIILLAGAHAGAKADTVFATEGTYPPWNETGADGRLSGFDIDLVHALCKRLAIACKIETSAFPGMMKEVAAGAFDAIISGIAITAEREKRIAFSRPYMSLSVSFAAAGGSRLAAAKPATAAATLRLLADGRLGAQGDTVNAKLIGSVLPNAALVIFDDQESLNRAVADGEVDAGLAATEAWKTPAPASPGAIATLGPPLTSNDYPLLGRGLGIGLAKSATGLKQSLDTGLCALSGDGTIAALSRKWFGHDLSVPCR